MLIFRQGVLIGALVTAVDAVSFYVFFRDAFILREGIKSYIPQIAREPHFGVYTRIAHSQIDKNGVGVFAIIDIPEGTSIFFGDTDELLWKDERELSQLLPEIRRLYDDFCIIQNNKYGCPRNFNQLTVAWYLNHSEYPNVTCNKDFNFVAKKEIRKGDELTVDYRTYNTFVELPRYIMKES